MYLRRLSLVIAVVAIAAMFGVNDARAAALPEPPRTFLDTTYPAVTGRTIAVAAGGNLQAALDAAQPGDVVTLQAGATFTGPFTVPNKTGSGWIIVRSSAEASLPAPGTRVTPAHASAMPKIITTSTQPALRTAAGAHHFRFVGIEVAPAWGVFVYNLISLGTAAETDVSQLPHDIVFDRCYIHGNAGQPTRRGIAMNSRSTAVIDSWVSEFKEDGADSQAIAGWNGPGPFKLVNNYLEGAGENVMFGGADPTIRGMVPADIEVRHNHVAKPVAWNWRDPSYAGQWWTVKNLFELKNAARVLVDGNVFENNWPSGQAGTAILFTVRSQLGLAPWATVADVAFTNNIVRHAAGGVIVLGHDYPYTDAGTQRVLIRNNLFDDIGGTLWNEDALFKVLDGAADVIIDHNTAFQTYHVMLADGAPNQRFVFTNNIARHNWYGFFGSGVGTGLPALNAYYPGYVFARNVLPGGQASLYPADNFFPASLDAVGFVNRASGDYRLSASSPYRGAGTDGKDIGVDFAALEAALTGNPAPAPEPPAPLPPPADTTAPTLSIGAPAASATVSGTVTVSTTFSDNVGVRSLEFRVDGALKATYAPPVASFSWDSRSVADGTHVLQVTARDAAGNTTVRSVSVTVRNTVGASVAVTSPANGSTIGHRTYVKAAATDPSGVSQMRVYADGKLIGSITCSSGVTCTGSVYWNTKWIARGRHTLVATSVNRLNVLRTSSAVIVYR